MLAPPQVLQATISEVIRIIKRPGVAKIPFMIKDMDDVAVSAKNIGKTSRIVPIFPISNVTGTGINLIIQFLNLLPAYKKWNAQVKQPFLAYIDDYFTVTGIGTVVAATIKQGIYSLGGPLRLGPDKSGAYRDVIIRSLHYKQVPVSVVSAGQEATFALRGIEREEIRKGMVLIDQNRTKYAVMEFIADTMVLYHTTTIRSGYETMIHCRTIRQQARILRIINSDKLSLRTGDHARVVFRFLFHPEYLMEGDRFVFREGRTRGIGVIQSVQPI